MAATVEGLFKIIDGASGPMKRMERQAKQTDKAIDKLGDRLDRVGSDKQLKQMDQVDRQIRSIDRDSRTFAGGSGGGGRLRSTLQGAGDDSDRLSTKLARVGISLASIGKIFQALKLPLIVAGVVALVQGVSALAGGLVALLPQLTDVAGVAAALPASLAGIGIAAISVKLALGGMGAALKGTKGAMAQLTPQAREFVRTLKELKPIGRSLRNSAQAGLLPGLTEALTQLKGGVPMAQRLLKRGGATVGGIADRAATAFTQPGFMRDLEGIGNQGLTVVNRLGSAFINVAEAIRHVAVVARPFTDWLTKTILGWTQMWEVSARAGRQTGEMSRFFDRTRASLETFGSILSNLWGTFRGIGKAARPLGEDLWESADKATDRWDRFANSLAGQNQLREYFDGLKDNLHAIFDFTGELSKAFLRLGTSSGFTSTADALTKAIQPLEHLFQMIGEKFGPRFAVTLEQLIRLFDNLGGTSSSLATLIDMLNLLLEGINALLEKIPGLSNLLAGVLSVAAISSLASRLRVLAGSWGLVAKGAADAAVAQRAAATSGAVAGAAGATGGFLPMIFGRGRGGVGRGGVAKPAGMLSAADMEAMGLGAAAGGGLARGAGGMLARGAGSLARFLGPVALLFGGVSALTGPGGLSAAPQRFASGATFGMIPEPLSTDQQQSKGGTMAGELSRNVFRNVKGKGLAGLKFARGYLGIGTGDPRELLEAGNTGTSILGGDTFNQKLSDSGIEAARAAFKKAIKQINMEIASRSADAGVKSIEDFSKAWAIRAKAQSARQAADALLQPLLKRIGPVLGKQGSTELANASLRWYATAAKHNPKLRGLYDELADGIERRFRRMGENIEVVNGRIYTGSSKEWKAIADGMSSQAERAKQEVSSAFTALQRQAVGSLIAMGYDRQQATNIVKGLEHGGAAGRVAEANAETGPVLNGQLPFTPPGQQAKMGHHGGHRARGGRVPGFGNQDRYALGGGHVGAAGELIVNKHTERDANALLGMFGTSLGRMVGKEGRPHSELIAHARGGRAGGGLESVGQYASGMGLSVSGGPGFGGVPSSGHVGGSLHYSGLAYDVSGAPALMMKFRRAAEARYLGHGLNELFYDPYSYYIDEGQKVPGSIGGHSDHVHIGFFPGGPSGASAVRGLMGGMGAFKALKAPRAKTGGVPGAMAQAGMNAMTKAMNAKLRKRAGVSAQGVPMLGGGNLRRYNHIFPSGVQLSPKVVEMIAASAGLPPVLFQQLAHGESNYEPGVVGTDPGGTHGYGLWQITTGVGNDAMINKLGGPRAMLNPLINARAAKMIYDSAGVGAWYGTKFVTGHSRGGRVPGFAGWFGQGGSVEAHGPTLLGIGDGGSEIATVRPKGRGRAGGGGGIRIGSLKIENHRPGDIRKQLEREVNEAFNRLADELDMAPDTDDEEVLA
jgi:hypothetical protein